MLVKRRVAHKSTPVASSRPMRPARLVVRSASTLFALAQDANAALKAETFSFANNLLSTWSVMQNRVARVTLPACPWFYCLDSLRGESLDHHQAGDLPQTGFGKINGDVRERDFWPSG